MAAALPRHVNLIAAPARIASSRTPLRLFVQNSTITLGVMVAITACSYAFQVIMARSLSVDAFGELNAIIATLNLLTIPLFGGALAITRAVAVNASSHVNTAEAVQIQSDRLTLLSLTLGAALLLASPLVAAFFHLSSALPIGLLAVLVVVSTLLGISRAVLVGLHRFVGFGLNQVVEALGRLVVGVALVALGLGQNAALAGYVAAMTVAFVPIRGCFPWRRESELRARVRRALHAPFSARTPAASIGGAATLVTGSVLVMLGGDLALVKHFFPEGGAGEYAALSTLGKVLYLIVSALDTVLFPAAAIAHTAGAQPHRQLALALASVAVVTGPLLAAYWLIPGTIVAIVFGSRYLEVAPLLGRYGAAALMISLAALMARYALALGRTRVRLALPLVALLEVLALTVLHESLDQVVNILLAIGAVALAVSILAGLLNPAPD